MRRIAILVWFAGGCVEHGEVPPSCDPDVQLTGLPGSTETVELELSGGEDRELCVVLDATTNDHDVTFLASDPFSPSATTLELHALDGAVLGRDDEQGVLRFVVPPGPRIQARLSITAAASISRVSTGVTLSFFEIRP